jgi:ribonuclease VapC
MSTVNLSGMVAKLAESGKDDAVIRRQLSILPHDVVVFELEDAYQAGHLRRSTRNAGLLFGDRACLALAMRLGLSALTADLQWQMVDIGVTVRLVP